MYSRRGNISSTPSLVSLSSIDVPIKEESLPNPETLLECSELLGTFHQLQHEKSKYKSDLIQEIKELRSQREPLMKIKSTLQEEISITDKAIKHKSEEVTQIKHKLRHLSEKQIQDNIDRLEFQLRNNNYKPREEQKILDEISMLRRSSKILKDFHLKQRENQKYRSERSRLIGQRNENFSKIQAYRVQEDELKKQLGEVKSVINSTIKTIEHLRNLLPDLEKAFEEEEARKEEAGQSRIKERERLREERFIQRKKERDKRWEEYEASRELYEKEKNVCKMVLAYLKSLLPDESSNHSGSYQTQEQTDSSSELVVIRHSETPDKASSGLSNYYLYKAQGKFYSKPSIESLEQHSKKQSKMKNKRKKSGKVRDLSHPPDVLVNLVKLDVSIPKTSEHLPKCIEAVRGKLELFYQLEKEKNSKTSVHDKVISNKSSDNEPSKSLFSEVHSPKKENAISFAFIGTNLREESSDTNTGKCEVICHESLSKDRGNLALISSNINSNTKNDTLQEEKISNVSELFEKRIITENDICSSEKTTLNGVEHQASIKENILQDRVKEMTSVDINELEPEKKKSVPVIAKIDSLNDLLPPESPENNFAMAKIDS